MVDLIKHLLKGTQLLDDRQFVYFATALVRESIEGETRHSISVSISLDGNLTILVLVIAANKLYAIIT